MLDFVQPLLPYATTQAVASRSYESGLGFSGPALSISLKSRAAAVPSLTPCRPASRPRRSGHDQRADAADPGEADDCYAFLEWQSNEVTRSLVGFTGLITPVPDKLSSAQWKASQPARNDQGMAIDDPRALYREPEGAGDASHCRAVSAGNTPLSGFLSSRYVSSAPINTPVFFRTDEAMLGKIVEVQSPGSLWGTYEQLQDYYRAHGFPLGGGFIREVGQSIGRGDRQTADRPSFLQSFLGERKLFRAKGKTICPLLRI